MNALGWVALTAIGLGILWILFEALVFGAPGDPVTEPKRGGEDDAS